MLKHKGKSRRPMKQNRKTARKFNKKAAKTKLVNVVRNTRGGIRM